MREGVCAAVHQKVGVKDYLLVLRPVQGIFESGGQILLPTSHEAQLWHWPDLGPSVE